MKIAIFSDNFYPELSGISDSIIALGKNLAKRGHQIDFYAARYPEKAFGIVNLPFQELDLGENVRIHRFYSFPAVTPTKQGRMVVPNGLRWLSMLKEKPDVVYTQLFFGVGMEALVAAKALDVPLVGTSHTPIKEFLQYGPLHAKWVEKVSSQFVSWYYNHCVFVTAPSNSILEEMKRFGFNKPSRVISNPIDLKNFSPASAEEKQKLKKEFDLSNKTVLFTGRLAPEKHVDVIIQAVALAKKQFPDINLVITGHGSSEGGLKKLAEELGIKDNVRFWGTVSEKMLVKAFQVSDIFAIASTAETQSISLMKAMSTGLPVIGVDYLALPEYIDNNNGFIVAPGDYDNMAEKIIYLLRNPERQKILGQGGIGTVRKFSEENITNEWEALFEKVISEKRQTKKVIEKEYEA